MVSLFSLYTTTFPSMHFSTYQIRCLYLPFFLKQVASVSNRFFRANEQKRNILPKLQCILGFEVTRNHSCTTGHICWRSMALVLKEGHNILTCTDYIWEYIENTQQEPINSKYIPIFWGFLKAFVGGYFLLEVALKASNSYFNRMVPGSMLTTCARCQNALEQDARIKNMSLKADV